MCAYTYIYIFVDIYICVPAAAPPSDLALITTASPAPPATTAPHICILRLSHLLLIHRHRWQRIMASARWQQVSKNRSSHLQRI